MGIGSGRILGFFQGFGIGSFWGSKGPLLAGRVSQSKIFLEKVKGKRVIVGRCMHCRAFSSGKTFFIYIFLTSNLL